MTTAHHLLLTAASTAFEVTGIEEHPTAPSGSMTIHLEIDDDDIEDGGIAQVFARRRAWSRCGRRWRTFRPPHDRSRGVV